MCPFCSSLITYDGALSCWPNWSLGLGSCSGQYSRRISVPVGTESGTGSEAWEPFCWTLVPLTEPGASYKCTSDPAQSWGWWAEPVNDCSPVPGRTLWEWLHLDTCPFPTESIWDCGGPPPRTRPGAWPLPCLWGRSCGTQTRRIFVSISALSSGLHLTSGVSERLSSQTLMLMKTMQMHCWWTPLGFQHLCSRPVGLISSLQI